MVFTVVFDAYVLYPAPVRDLLMEIAIAGLVAAKWSEDIHDEWLQNLAENRPDISREKLERTKELMDEAVPDAIVRNYEPLIECLELPDPNDRHVLAEAIKSGAQTVMTQ